MSLFYQHGDVLMTLNSALAAHYRQLLGLKTPWRITSIDMSIIEKRIDIAIEWPSGKRVSCPECGKRCSLKDHRTERIWRHLDTMQFQTFLHCRVPRSECRIHGAKTIAIPWGEANSRWTLLYETFALLVLVNVPALTKAAEILHISWEEAFAIRTRAVKRGLAHRSTEDIEYLGIDEKSFGKKVRFITVLSDLNEGRILEVAPKKSTAAAKTTIAVIPEEERGTIKAVAMDMAAPYEKACVEMLPDAEWVYDKFHIEKMLSEAMNKVRNAEHNILLSQGVGIFKRKKYLFLRRKERWSEKQKQQFRDVKREYGAVKFAHSKIGRAWAIKESFRPFWDYVSVGWARKYFQRWYFWATHSRMKPLIKVARTLKAHLDGILSYFRHGITNAFAEGINSKIQMIKSSARGFRSFENYRIAILFHCGKLNLNPQ